MATEPGFRAFAQLPAELRLKIWEAAIWPRVLEVKYSTCRWAYTSRTSQPAILQVNQESRAVGKRAYAQCVGHSWMHYGQDVLYFRNNYGNNPMTIIFEELSRGNVRNVRQFAIDPLFVIGPWDVCISKRWWEVFDRLPALRTVSIVVDGTELVDELGDLRFEHVEGREKGPSWEELLRVTMEDWDAYAKGKWEGGRPKLEFVSVVRI